MRKMGRVESRTGETEEEWKEMEKRVKVVLREMERD